MVCVSSFWISSFILLNGRLWYRTQSEDWLLITSYYTRQFNWVTEVFLLSDLFVNLVVYLFV